MTYKELDGELAKTRTRLVAVSKTKPVSEIKRLYEEGHRDFGENRVQEMVDKAQLLPKDIRWHMIGHLQRKKVKHIADFVYLIHSVDSLRLLGEINKQAKRNDRIIPCLLQVKIAEEDTKYGLSQIDLNHLLHSEEYLAMNHLEIRGLMGMATFTKDEDQVRREFANLRSIFDQTKQLFFPQAPFFREISMGMSGDYKIAVEEGSTIVRIGSLLFGERD